jgi:hypothetical protein
VDAGVVVLDLVVVPGGRPGEDPVDLLQVGVGLVERVLEPVAGERAALLAQGAGDLDLAIAAGGGDAAFVDVVAQVDDEVDVLLGHPPVRRVETVLPRLAGRERERELGHRPARRRLGPPGRAGVPARDEAVVVDAAGLQAVYVHVHGVRQLGERGNGARGDDVREALVGRQLPLHLHALRPDAAVLRERLGRQPRPEGHTARVRLARGDAERERVARQRRSRDREVAANLAVQRGAGERAGPGQESAPVDPPAAQLRKGRTWITHWISSPRGSCRAHGRHGARISVAPRRRNRFRYCVGAACRSGV